jgi:HK97 family phage major capsid protein
MQGRLLPNSIGRAVWLINPAVRPLLPLMKFDTAATSPVPVYLPQTGVSGMPYGSLYGMPILPMMGGSKALGDEGDISLVDLSYYYTAVKTTGIKSDMSAHVYFSTGEMAFRFTMRLAGQCPFKAPITSENGSYSMSGFVTLEDR